MGYLFKTKGYQDAIEEFGLDLANEISIVEYNEYVRGRGFVGRYKSHTEEGEDENEELYRMEEELQISFLGG